MGSNPKREWLSNVSLLSLGMSLGALVLAFVSAGEIYDYQDSVDGVHLPPVDAIVCLAGGRGRIAVAGDLWYHYVERAEMPMQGLGRSPVPAAVPQLYLSGMGARTSYQTVSKQVRKGILGALSPEHVVIEKQSANTEENALFLLNYAREHDWHTIVLITSPYHMRRARLIFERLAAMKEWPLKVETLSVYQEPFEPSEWRSASYGIRVTVYEYLKWLYYSRIWKP